MTNLKGQHVFLSGPITGRNRQEVERIFLAARLACLEAGAESVFVPTLAVPESFGHEEAMLYCISCLTEYRVPHVTPFFSALLSLPNWQSSRGAVLERKVAKACGIACYDLEPDGRGSYEVVE